MKLDYKTIPPSHPAIVTSFKVEEKIYIDIIHYNSVYGVQVWYDDKYAHLLSNKWEFISPEFVTSYINLAHVVADQLIKFWSNHINSYICSSYELKRWTRILARNIVYHGTIQDKDRKPLVFDQYEDKDKVFRDTRLFIDGFIANDPKENIRIVEKFEPSSSSSDNGSDKSRICANSSCFTRISLSETHCPSCLLENNFNLAQRRMRDETHSFGFAHHNNSGQDYMFDGASCD